MLSTWSGRSAGAPDPPSHERVSVTSTSRASLAGSLPLALLLALAPAAPAPAQQVPSTPPSPQDVLGWEPKIDLREGIRRTLPYFRAELERHDAKARTM